MSTFITLMNWTDQGVRAFKDTPQRADAFATAAEKLGAKVVHFYWTVGPYDAVALVEAPDEETATATSLQLSSLGNIRSTTLRAFGRPEMDTIIDKALG